MLLIPPVCIVMLVILGISSGDSQDQPLTTILSASACTAPYVELSGGCFYFHETFMNWHDARDYCRGLSGDNISVDLATVADCDQASRIYQHIIMEYGALWHWLGGSDEGQEGNWHWVTGDSVPMGHPFWYPGHPDNYPENNCLAIHRTTGYFVAYGCENTGPFVCQQF